MRTYDFDPDIQEYFYTSFADIKPTDWQSWLNLTTKEEYEELALKNSGLSSVDKLDEKLLKEKSSSKDLSIDLNHFITENQKFKPLILCHSSGTTNSNVNALKWFYMSKEVVQNQWAPGMQAIFESSGLSSKSTAVIFVPSRMKFDGVHNNEESEYISLYSSEFSQRVMLSIIKPNSYLFHEYKDSKTLQTISEILSLEDIAVISAPAATVLGWANIDKLEEGIKRSLTDNVQIEDSNLNKLTTIVKREDLSSACRIIQEKLSEKLSNATLVFSTSSLSESDWTLIRRFMKWEKGHERFTNLYVVSEIGPFAASITKGDFRASRSNRMYVFPLTLSVIEHDGKKELISKARNRIGKLLVSRLHKSDPIININIGDVITILDQKNLPQIEGKIRRACFELKYPIKITNKINLKTNYSLYVGDYFPFKDFSIIDPRNFINCLNNKYHLKNDAILLLNKNNHKWKLYIAPANLNGWGNQHEVHNDVLKCSEEIGLKKLINKGNLKIVVINESPVDFLAPRSEILAEVRSGKLPKGILKKWPLYLLKIEG